MKKNLCCGPKNRCRGTLSWALLVFFPFAVFRARELVLTFFI
jgi:hypothetical protein